MPGNPFSIAIMSYYITLSKQPFYIFSMSFQSQDTYDSIYVTEEGIPIYNVLDLEKQFLLLCFLHDKEVLEINFKYKKVF